MNRPPRRAPGGGLPRASQSWGCESSASWGRAVAARPGRGVSWPSTRDACVRTSGSARNPQSGNNRSGRSRRSLGRRTTMTSWTRELDALAPTTPAASNGWLETLRPGGRPPLSRARLRKVLADLLGTGVCRAVPRSARSVCDAAGRGGVIAIDVSKQAGGGRLALMPWKGTRVCSVIWSGVRQGVGPEAGGTLRSRMARSMPVSPVARVALMSTLVAAALRASRS
jgi:hypothetical protein